MVFVELLQIYLLSPVNELVGMFPKPWHEQEYVLWHWNDIKNINTFMKIIIISVDSTLVQLSIRRLCSRWLDAWTIVVSTLVKKEFILFYSRDKQFNSNINTNLFWIKLFRNTFFNILHIGGSANTAKVMVWQNKIWILNLTKYIGFTRSTKV